MSDEKMKFGNARWRVALRIVGISLVLVAAVVIWQHIFPHRFTPPKECIQRGVIESPQLISITGPHTEVSGWVFDYSGIGELQVRSGDQVISRGKPDRYREDIATAFPECSGTGKTSFSLVVPTGVFPLSNRTFDVVATDGRGQLFSLGSFQFQSPGPLGNVDTVDPIDGKGESIVAGWAVAPDGHPRVSVMARGKEIAQAVVGDVRDDVGLLFPAWSDSSRSGFAVRLPLAQLPRGRYQLSIRLESPDGGIRLLSGPEVRNDEPLVKVLASADRMVRPQDFELSAWVLTETGVDSVRIETDTGIDLGSMRLTEKHISLSAFERIKVSHGANRLIGKVFRGQVRTKGLPPSLYRLQVVVIDRENRRTVFPGPLVRSGSSGNEACAGQLRYLYYPGNHRAFRQDFPVAQSWAQLVSGQCVQVGIRGRVEYLRTTFGHKQDYRFDPNFPDSHQMKDGREMIGVALRTLLNMANRTGLPLLITLDGGVWADSAFSYPEFDVVDMLERREDTVQWNQHGHSEPDDALNNLAASFENPHLARMMSLNRFNEDFRRYKKRNLQAAVQEVVRFMKANPTIDVAINLDPDEYVNPWFQDTQWYDYNPDTLRQFREWLFHRGPYADGGELARARHEPRLTLTEAGKLAGRRFREIDDVDPPRNAIDYSDKWQHLWAWFRRHLVAQHYDDLARWAAEAGMPTGKIFTAQTFIQADVAVSLDDSARGWTDQAGVSIAGAKPRQGHLGAILYGPASRNFGKPRKGLSLIGNIRGIDPHWGVIEFHPATIEKPQTMPGHDDAYQTMFSIINGGARFMSPMWGSRADDQWLYPERFRSYDSMDGTPFEFQLAWWMLKLQRLPAGSLIYPFGNSSVSSNDGWTVDASTHMNVLPGQLQLSGSRLHLQSPILEGQIASSGVRLELDGSWTGRQVQAGIRLSGGRRGSCMLDSTTRSCSLSLNPLASIEQITFDWMPVVSGMPDIPVTVDEIRVFPQ